MNTETRFWTHVDKQGPRFGNRGRCWLWTGAKDYRGYGYFRMDNKRTPAHRFAYGDVPDGLETDHLCRRRVCVRRSHLEAVTHAENVRRGIGNGYKSKTHCLHGHPLSGDNLYVWPDGRRQCRTCQREHWRRWRAKQVAA